MQEPKVDTVIHGGLVVSSTDAYEAAVAIKGEKVVAVGPREMLPPAERYIDTTGKYVLPGPIDCHIHLGAKEEGRADDWTSGPIAAAHAGITSIVSFVPLRISEKETPPNAVKRLTELVSKESVIDFSFHCMLNNQPYLYQDLGRFIPEVMSLGVPSFKMFMTYNGRVTDEYMARAMDIIAANGGLAQVHCENGGAPDFLQEKAIAEGRVSPKDYPSTRPAWIEDEAVNRAIHLANMTNCPLHIVHLASKGALELIVQAQAQARGQWISVET